MRAKTTFSEGLLKGGSLCYEPTRRGNQFPHNAQERMMRRNPTASTKDRSITAIMLLANMGPALSRLRTLQPSRHGFPSQHEWYKRPMVASTSLSYRVKTSLSYLHPTLALSLPRQLHLSIPNTRQSVQ